MARYIVCTILILLFSSCGKDSQVVLQEYDLLLGQNFFENSPRRDPTPSEAKKIMRVFRNNSNGSRRGCTGFLVENSENRIYLATARHCFNWSIGNACRDDIVRAQFLIEGEEHLGKCVRPVIGFYEYDFTIVELEVDELDYNSLIQHYTPLKLASYSPKVGTELKMLGFPGDPERGGSGLRS